MTAPDAPRMVLDTNVCLDLFVFNEPRVQALRGALRSGEVVAVTNADCRDEWLRVLDYPKLALTDAQRAAARTAFDATVGLLPGDACGNDAGARLPRCADPDDQKFLQLAHVSGARWLLSRDDALLVLGRRTVRDGLFAILAPEAWSLMELGQISKR